MISQFSSKCHTSLCIVNNLQQYIFNSCIQSFGHYVFCIWHKSTIYCSYFCLYAQLCLIPRDPMNCSPPGFSLHEIFQTRTLEWVAISYSRGSSLPREWTHIPCISCNIRWIIDQCTTWKAHFALDNYLLKHLKMRKKYIFIFTFILIIIRILYNLFVDPNFCLA